MTEPTLAPESCPECRSGKHPNCPEGYWDIELDVLIKCPCAERNHQ